MNQSTVSKFVYGAAFTVAACLAGTASAGNSQSNEIGVTSTGLRTVTVSYADLDMADTKAQEIFYDRVSHAARQVCGSPHRWDVGSLIQASKNKQCFQGAMSEAMQQVPNTQVAAVSK